MDNKIYWAKIDQLLDKDYAFAYFSKKLKKIDSSAKKLVSLKLYTIKNHRGKTNRHVVVYYAIRYINSQGKEKRTRIVASAHSSGCRYRTYKVMRFIYAHGFNNKKYKIPKPLMYNMSHRALFYYAAPGHNLYSYMREADWKTFEINSFKLAVWLAKFHELPVQTIRLKTLCLTRKSVDPTDLMDDKNPTAIEFKNSLVNIYKTIKKKEKKLVGQKNQLVHGDLHPENVIISPDGEFITVIDFTEAQRGDFTYDIASYCQQVEAMSMGYFSKEKVRDHQKKFLEAYFKERNIGSDQNTDDRINLYMAWVALRGAIYFINSHRADKIREFIKECEYYLSKINS